MGILLGPHPLAPSPYGEGVDNSILFLNGRKYFHLWIEELLNPAKRDSQLPQRGNMSVNFVFYSTKQKTKPQKPGSVHYSPGGYLLGFVSNLIANHIAP